MAKKALAAKGFGKRLLAARKEQGLTQVQLAKAIGSTQRDLSYYENEEGYPPVPMVIELAQALKILKISTDELLGVKTTKRQGVRGRSFSIYESCLRKTREP